MHPLISDMHDIHMCMLWLGEMEGYWVKCANLRPQLSHAVRRPVTSSSQPELVALQLELVHVRR